MKTGERNVVFVIDGFVKHNFTGLYGMTFLRSPLRVLKKSRPASNGKAATLFKTPCLVPSGI